MDENKTHSYELSRAIPDSGFQSSGFARGEISTNLLHNVLIRSNPTTEVVSSPSRYAASISSETGGYHRKMHESTNG